VTAQSEAVRVPPTINIEDVMREAIQKPSLLDALEYVAIWENDRAVLQALKGKRDPNTGKMWDTLFKHAFTTLFQRWSFDVDRDSENQTYIEKRLALQCANITELQVKVAAQLNNPAQWPEMPAWAEQTEGDKPLPAEDPKIYRAFPTRSERHDLYGEAMRLVGARYSKAGIVALVNWLLHEADFTNKIIELVEKRKAGA
jgi:hypothetical protein